MHVPLRQPSCTVSQVSHVLFRSTGRRCCFPLTSLSQAFSPGRDTRSITCAQAPPPWLVGPTASQLSAPSAEQTNTQIFRKYQSSRQRRCPSAAGSRLSKAPRIIAARALVPRTRRAPRYYFRRRRRNHGRVYVLRLPAGCIYSGLRFGDIIGDIIQVSHVSDSMPLWNVTESDLCVHIFHHDASIGIFFFGQEQVSSRVRVVVSESAATAG